MQLSLKSDRNYWIATISLVLLLTIILYSTDNTNYAEYGNMAKYSNADQSKSVQQIEQYKERNEIWVHREIGYLIYFKDARTGLCFATSQSGSDGRMVTLACVPCEKVEHLLVSSATPGELLN